MVSTLKQLLYSLVLLSVFSLSSVSHSYSTDEERSDKLMELVLMMSEKLCELSKSGSMYPRSINKIDNEEETWLTNILIKKYDYKTSTMISKLVMKTSFKKCPRSF